MNIRIAGLQKLTLLDFPGRVACTLFLAGCNFRCPFCHNAALVVEKAPEAMSIEALVKFLRMRKGILDGVCITGGEPTLWEELPQLIRLIKDEGYLCKLDTNGSSPARVKAALEAGVDYVAMDLKSSPRGYERAVGVGVDPRDICESMALIKASGVAHEFRTTLVKGLHTPEDVADMASMVGNSAYFLQAFIDSGNLIDATGLSAFDAREMETMRRVALASAPRTALRGV